MDVKKIEQFVRSDLGCGCPAEVFSDIRVEDPRGGFEGLPVDYVLAIGGRLLIVVCRANQLVEIMANIERIVRTGREMRDQRGFNRFRLVVPSSDDHLAGPDLQYSFCALAGADERMHLHLVEPSSIPAMVCKGYS